MVALPFNCTKCIAAIEPMHIDVVIQSIDPVTIVFLNTDALKVQSPNIVSLHKTKLIYGGDFGINELCSEKCKSLPTVPTKIMCGGRFLGTPFYWQSTG
jgi:hypothetical protein